MGIESILGVGATLIGGASESKAAKKAAQAQTDAANADIAFQKETFDTIRSDLAPYRQGGSTAQEALLFELGLGSRPTIGGQAAQIETIQSAPQPFRPDPRGNALGGYRARGRGNEESSDLHDDAKAISDAVAVPIIASGGVGNLQHLADGVLKGGADAVLAASIFHFAEIPVPKLKEYLKEQNIPVR